MSVKTRYANEPIGRVKIVPDFLPPPEALAFRSENTRVTISLSRRSVDFFKKHAERNGTQYQRMIRELLDACLDAHTESAKPRTGGIARRRAAKVARK